MANKHTKYVALMRAFGKAVRFYRNKLGFSQEALADRAQLDRSYMSQIERGIKNATLNSIWRISQALQVESSALLKLTEDIDAAGEHSAELLSQKLGAAVANIGQSASPMVLVVDDDEDICQAIGALLHDAGFQTTQAGCGMDAVQMLASSRIDCVVSDVRMANGNGLELLERLRKHYPQIPVFFITGYDDISEEDAKRRGAAGLFNKPFDMGSLVTSVRSSLPGEAAALN